MTWIKPGAQFQVQASLALIEHIDLANLRSISIKSVADNHFEFLTKFTQLISVCTPLVWGFWMASASNDVWRSYAGTMIRYITERGDLHPLWRLIILLIIIRLLRWVEYILGFLSLESLHGTQGRYSARNLLNTIHCLVEFSLLFLLIQKSLEINESFLFRYFDHLSLDLGGNLSRNLGVYSSCSNTLGLSLLNVLVRKVGCL